MINLQPSLSLSPVSTAYRRPLCIVGVVLKTHPLSGKHQGPVGHIKDKLCNQLAK